MKTAPNGAVFISDRSRRYQPAMITEKKLIQDQMIRPTTKVRGKFWKLNTGGSSLLDVY